MTEKRPIVHSIGKQQGRKSVSGLRSSSRSFEGSDSDTKQLVSKRIGGKSGENLHDDENSNIDGQKARPCEPSNILKLADTCQNKNSDCRNKHKPISADGMVRQHIESHRCTKDTGCADDGVCDEEKNSNDLLEPCTADNIGHVGDGMAACMRIAKVALDNGAVRVQSLPAKDIDRTGKCTEDEHG
ncbi:hypothetical protein HG531_004472 [Fusarium graminearum]|nr:hypothetical protein HG531_004472 [Fusarium graminearum]